MGKQTTPASTAAKPLQVFKAGRHTAMGGQTISFSQADLQATCAAYDPAKHEAPLVIGHPKHDGPAYGWVQSLSFSEGDGSIDATPAQVNPDFADMVAARAYGKISASFYSPDAPQNPVPGVYYLRHVGFLGAQAPAIKGLRSPSFADGEEGVLSFSEWSDVDNAGLWRSMRDWLIGKFGREEADAALPGYQVASVEQGAQDDLREALAETAATNPTPAFSESPQLEPTVTPEEKAALEAENTRLKAEIAEGKAKARAAQDHAAHVAFCESIPVNRLVPAWRDTSIAVMDNLAAQPATVEFGEGEARKPLLDGFKAMLQALPEQVSFGESATGARAAAGDDGTVMYAEGTDPERIAQDRAIRAHMAANKTSYIAAAHAVLKK